MILLYFAWVRQKIGKSEERIELPSDVKTVRALAGFLAARGGGYAEAFAEDKKLRVAVNQEHGDWDTPLQSEDEVAFFPPVTGG